MGLGVRQQNPTKGLAKSTTWYWAASSLRRSLARQGLGSWYVAECGKGEPGPLNCDHFYQAPEGAGTIGNGWPPPPFQP
jgi:hypothetical protein